MRVCLVRMTPGDTWLWRGMLAVCSPQGQVHLVWSPSSDVTAHPWLVSARLTLRRFIDCTTVALAP